MNVIYNTCFADPWIKVAGKLKEEQGFEPVYWIGHEDDNSRQLVPAAFPNIIYQSYYNAWKGIFPDEITAGYSLSNINIDFIKEYAAFELQAITMMDRMDPDRHSFSFTERRRHFRNFLKYWTACIHSLKVDLVVSAVVPHRVYDYALYLLCKFNNIKYVTFRDTAFHGRIIPITQVYSIGTILDKEYADLIRSSMDAEDLNKMLDAGIREKYEMVKMDYSVAEPDYMKQGYLLHDKSSGFLQLMRKFFHDLFEYRQLYFGQEGFFKKGIHTFYKQKNKSIEKSNYSILQYSLFKMRSNAYKKKLKEHYNSLVEKPDFTVPYVIFTLHYQPEMTSNPSGDIFVDQRLCVDVLANHLPPGYLIYVKEHPAQFYAHDEGHTSRIPEFYTDLLSYPQVRLMPLNTDPFLLIKHAIAVVTITGTSGWEAMVRAKPVIIFGLSWYEKYSGVLKISDERSAASITQFIENFRFDERDLLSYLNAIGQKSVKAYYYRGLKETMNQPEDECVANLANSIIQMVEVEEV